MGIEAVLLSQVITISGTTGQVVTRQADGTLALEDAAGGGIGGSTGSTDNAILRADGTGGATLQNSGVTISDNSEVLIVSGAASAKPLCVRAAASQTANLQEWQNSAGTLLSSIDSAGRVIAPSGSFNDVSLRIGSSANGFSVFNNEIWVSATSQSALLVSGSRLNIRQSSILSWSSNSSVINNTGDIGLRRVEAGLLEVNSGTAGAFRDLIVRNLRMSAPSIVPASASATGSEGQISWDADYLYICTATNTWKRVAIATW